MNRSDGTPARRTATRASLVVLCTSNDRTILESRSPRLIQLRIEVAPRSVDRRRLLGISEVASLDETEADGAAPWPRRRAAPDVADKLGRAIRLPAVFDVTVGVTRNRAHESPARIRAAIPHRAQPRFAI